MPFEFVSTSRQPPLAENIYSAEVKSIVEATKDGNPYLKWTFVVDHNGSSREITGVSSTKFGRESKARSWVEGILGRPVARDEKVNTDLLCGKKCRLLLSVKDLQDGDQPVNRVEKVFKVEEPVPF